VGPMFIIGRPTIKVGPTEMTRSQENVRQKLYVQHVLQGGSEASAKGGDP